MEIPKKLILVFVLLLIAALIVGFIAGFAIGSINQEESEKEPHPRLYESRCSLYYSVNTYDEAAQISTPDMKASAGMFAVFSEILQSNSLRQQILEQYPDAEFELALEQKEGTGIFYIIATGEDPENLDEICNFAASAMIQKAEQIVPGSSFKIIDPAKEP